MPKRRRHGGGGRRGRDDDDDSDRSHEPTSEQESSSGQEDQQPSRSHAAWSSKSSPDRSRTSRRTRPKRGKMNSDRSAAEQQIAPSSSSADGTGPKNRRATRRAAAAAAAAAEQAGEEEEQEVQSPRVSTRGNRRSGNAKGEEKEGQVAAEGIDEDRIDAEDEEQDKDEADEGSDEDYSDDEGSVHHDDIGSSESTGSDDDDDDDDDSDDEDFLPPVRQKSKSSRDKGRIKPGGRKSGRKRKDMASEEKVGASLSSPSSRTRPSRSRRQAVRMKEEEVDGGDDDDEEEKLHAPSSTDEEMAGQGVSRNNKRGARGSGGSRKAPTLAGNTRPTSSTSDRSGAKEVLSKPSGNSLEFDPVPRYTPRPGGHGRIRLCAVKDCSTISRGARCDEMCAKHYHEWQAEAKSPGLQVDLADGDEGVVGDEPMLETAVTPPTVVSPSSGRGRSTKVKSNGGRSPRSRSTSRRRKTRRADDHGDDNEEDDDEDEDNLCYIDGCCLPKLDGRDTGRVHKPLDRGPDKDDGSDDNDGEDGELEEEDANEVVEIVSDEVMARSLPKREVLGLTGMSPSRGKKLCKDLCRVDGCPKFKQSGRDGMCAAHFNASKCYGLEEVLATGIELSSPNHRGKQKGGRPRSSIRGGRSSSAMSSPSAAQKDQKNKMGRPVGKKRSHPPAAESARDSLRSPPKKKKRSVEQKTPPPKSPAEKLGLPPAEENKSRGLCLVGDCKLTKQKPREYGMCRHHYRDLVEPLPARGQKRFVTYAQRWKTKKKDNDKTSSKVAEEIQVEEETLVEEDQKEGLEGHSRDVSSIMLYPEAPSMVDERRAPDISDEMVRPINKHVFEVWKELPSVLYLNAAPPIPPPVRIDAIGAVDVPTNGDILPKAKADEGAELTSAANGGGDVRLDPKHNYNVIYLAVKSRLAAKDHASALLLCQKALREWYDCAEKYARFHPCSEGKIPGIPAANEICDGLAGLWCVYAWLLQELATTDSAQFHPDEDCKKKKAKKQLFTSSVINTTAVQLHDASTAGFAFDATATCDENAVPLYLSDIVIPNELFGISHDGVEWKDVLAALKVATECPLAGRRSWPWLARARATVLAGNGATTTGSNEATPRRKDHRKSDASGSEDANGLNDLFEAYKDAVMICREGIDRMSPSPPSRTSNKGTFGKLSYIEKSLESTFDTKSVKALCNEINCMCDMKNRVEESLTEKKKKPSNENGIIIGPNGLVNGQSNGPVKTSSEQQQRRRPPALTNKSKVVDEVFGDVEWSCSTCNCLFNDEDKLRAHKGGCEASSAGATEDGGSIFDVSKTIDTTKPEYHHPISCAPIYDDEEAADVLDYLVEIFPATKAHLDLGKKMGRQPISPAKGEPQQGTSRPVARKPDFEGQVGLRCIHCRDVDESMVCANAAVYPHSVTDLHRAMWRMRVSHFEFCRNLPDDARARYEAMRDSLAPDGDVSKRYWEEAALGMGLGGVQDGGLAWPDSRKATRDGVTVKFDLV